MSKKREANQNTFDLGEAQKRRDQYVDACNKAQKGKIAALSMLGVTILCLLVLLIVSLKLNGTGLTVVGNGETTTAIPVNVEITEHLE